MAKIFSDLESAVGLSDFEAELLVRWLWKFEGLSWLQLHSRCTYSPAFTLRDRVLNQLGSIRSHLCLAVSLLDHIDPTYGDAPVGIDSRHHTGAIFVSGVFCRIALMSDRVSCTVITIRREVLVLVPLGCRRCYCGGSALFLFSLSAGGRVGSFNILPWLAILAALAAVVGGSVWLRSTGQRAVAIILLLLLAIPGALSALLLTSHLDSPARLSLTLSDVSVD